MGRKLSDLQKFILRTAFERRSKPPEILETLFGSVDAWGKADIYRADVLTGHYGFRSADKYLRTGTYGFLFDGVRLRHGGAPPNKVFDVANIGEDRYRYCQTATWHALKQLEERRLVVMERAGTAHLTEAGLKRAKRLRAK